MLACAPACLPVEPCTLQTCKLAALPVQNAVTIATKFRDLSGLQLVLQQELRELGKAQQAAMDELTRLQVPGC